MRSEKCYPPEKKLIIVCDDIYGLDIYTMIKAINNNAIHNGGSFYDIVGFITDKINPFGDNNPPAPIICAMDEYDEMEKVSFVMGIRDPIRKEMIAGKMKERGAHFETLIAPWVLLPFNFTVGEGSIIGNYNLKQNSVIGDFVTIDTGMCESVEIGDYSTLCPFVNMTSSRIGKRVFVGSHSMIMSRLNIGDDSYIYPGSIVVKNVKPGSIIAGVPASSSKVKKWDGKRV